MKLIKWKTLIITCLLCLLPILLGISLWSKLPDAIAIHFNFSGEPDNFASKPFAVFALPAIMAFLQGFLCIASDVNSHKYKSPTVSKWIIPVMSLLLQAATLGYALGQNIDMRKISVFIVGAVFVVIGTTLPKIDYIKNYKIAPEKAKKINRFLGYETAIMGVLFIISIFLPPIGSVICLFLLIPYIIVSLIYGIMITKK